MSNPNVSYFERPGRYNTEATLAAARERAFKGVRLFDMALSRAFDFHQVKLPAGGTGQMHVLDRKSAV